jgi:hypothetical protein
MIEELERCCELFIQTDRLLDTTFKPVREKYGFTDDRLKQAHAEMLDEARAGVDADL